MYGGYSNDSGTYSQTLTAVPQPRSGLEAAVEAAITATTHPRELPNNYAWKSYETMRQHTYVATQMHNHGNNFGRSYTATPYSAPTVKTTINETTAATPIYHGQPITFLSPSRPKAQFVAAATEVAAFIREAFLATTKQQLPDNITITVAPRETLQKLHSQFFNHGVVGLSQNNTREIFAVAGSLDEVMLVIGHELGHVLSPALNNQQAEEAKAFAFEMAWAQAIFEEDIGGLQQSINQAALSIKPAQNGLHDLAFAFVKAATLISGKDPLALHAEIAARQDFDISNSSFAAAPAQVSYVPLISSTAHRAGYHSGGYRNKSRVQNVPFLTNFTWTDLGTGIYGMYIPLTASIFMNDRLLRTDLEQFHKTLGHEYVLHHVMQLPDNYVTKILEDTIFWVKHEEDKYKP